MPRKRTLFPFFARLTASSLLCLAAACGPVGTREPAQEPGKPRQLFALMGDAPYTASEAERLDSLIDGLNAERLGFVAHVGDITSGRGPCTDAWFAERKRQFARLKAPFILLPGDNDWTDCHRSGFDPLERLAAWRRLFCLPSLPPELKLERQAGEYCEHVRWEFDRVLFVALNVQGSNNNLGRNKAADAEYRARMRRVLAWIDDSEKAFLDRKLDGLALLMQADPFLRPRSGSSGFTDLLARVERLAAAYPRQFTLVHGDSHIHRDDYPFPGLHRIEVHGSPFVAWLRAFARDGALDAEVGGRY